MELPESKNKRAASPLPDKYKHNDGNEAVVGSKRQAVDDPDTGEPTAARSAVGGESNGHEQEKASNLDTDTVTMRAILGSKYTGNIIGKGGSTISWIRSQSQAKVLISDTDRSNQTDERIVTVTGTCAAVFRAFTFMCDKIRESQQANSGQSQDVTMRLAIPHVQAGAVIGKKGAKIREIREATNAKISVHGDLLPNSAERCCVVTGGVEPVAQSIFHIACTLLQNAVKIPVKQYVPGAGILVPKGLEGLPRPSAFNGPPNPYGGFGAPPAPAGFGNFRAPQVQQSIQVANDIIGAIIGRGGSKINEIRTTSQAVIKIADKESGVAGTSERTINISGSPEAVQMAQYLIQTRMQEAMMSLADGVPLQ